MRTPHQKRILVQSVAIGISVLVLSAGCSTNTSSPPAAKLERVTAGADSATIPIRITDNREHKKQIRQDFQQPMAEAEMNEQSLSDHTDALAQPAPSINSVLTKPATARELVQLLSKEHTVQVIKNTEKYQQLDSNPVIRVADQSTSTFSIDVDTGAYANVRRFLNSGQLPPADAVRVEEMLNYFRYDYPVPDSTEVPFSIHTELSHSPWNANTRLLHIGLKGYEVNPANRPAANLVFLLDVSGSMADTNKLPLLKSSINMLTKELNEHDRVSIVVYAGASGVVLEPTAGNEYRTISKALNKLQAGGSTNGEAGIELAYSLAEENMTDTSINRIILATDGDFNVGISNIDKLKTLIERKRKSGIALTTLGFGTGNYNDHLMEQIADVGNGSYAYIDTLNEARKVLSEELTSTLLTIAKDVIIQIEFNLTQVSEYRLLGYVNRRLANEDFANDKVDAGEIGAGHTVTALYEIALTGDGGEWNSESRYKQDQKVLPDAALGDEIAEIRLRFKHPEQNSSELIKRQVKRSSLIDNLTNASPDFRFSAAVAGFGQLLRQNKYLDDFNYEMAAELASDAKGADRFGYRAELVQMIDLADNLDQQRQANVVSPNKIQIDENEG